MKRVEHISRKRLIAQAVCVVLALALLGGLAYFGGRRLEMLAYGDKSVRGDLSMHDADLRLVTYEGKQYAYNERLTTILFMGIDRGASRPGSTAGFRNGGQADFLMLMIIDPVNKTLTQMHIDRDTIAPITVLGVLGNEAGTKDAQICLSHGFGDGKAQSCRYTVEAVQRLMYGISIDGYYAMNLDGIPVLNDLLGGVTVTIEDDFSAFAPAMVPGATITLHGEQTELFVRSRMEIGDGTNFSRMRRQRQFLNNAISLSFERIREDNGFFATLLDGLNPYITTDIARGRILNEANRAASYTVEETINPEGQYVDGADGFIEFHVDQQALMELVLGLFYEPV